MSKVMKISILGVVALCVYSQPAMSREFADIYTECGIGAMIAPRNETVAAITNVTWDWGTTAISSNISSPDTCKGGQEKTAAFIHDSYEHLEKDLASGHGTYLDTLTALTGCDANGQQEFVEALRLEFTKVVGDSSYTDKSRLEKAEALYNLVYKLVDGHSQESGSASNG
ncbi:MAG TPA: hypothetical protein DD723_00320 [Candidatus Omnitrophica bacterium]|nr:MAG: hypothetical protein A2Z81_04590 [Omnitrophica WOR_2 bacterium GWA2_45_18]HBR13976.1 hypothetical protein [Candidatus Omnitrophota bacterium]